MIKSSLGDTFKTFTGEGVYLDTINHLIFSVHIDEHAKNNHNLNKNNESIAIFLSEVKNPQNVIKIIPFDDFAVGIEDGLMVNDEISLSSHDCHQIDCLAWEVLQKKYNLIPKFG